MSLSTSAATPLTLGGAGVAVSYTQGGARATLDSSLTIADPSSTTLSGQPFPSAPGLSPATP